MEKSPPVYTFRRPKQYSNTSSALSKETYVDLYSSDPDDKEKIILRYSRYNFILLLLIFLLLVGLCCFAYKKGLPVKIKG